jgi:hypothetical protein
MPKTGGGSPTRKARKRLEGRRRAVVQGWQAQPDRPNDGETGFRGCWGEGTARPLFPPLK